MRDSSIIVQGLSKRYFIDHQRAKGEGLRHKLEQVARNPLSWFRGTANGIRTKKEEFWALKDVNFEVAQGEVVGIIGRNGAGKSTLLKVLSRITEPTTGRVQLKGRISSLLEVGTGFHQELTGRENIFLNGAILGMTKAEIRQRFDEIVAFSELEKFLDIPVKWYSSGMYVRLAFAVAAHLEPDILIVDEVLAVGDVEFQKKCLGKMENAVHEGRTVLFVSHNMSAVRRLCSRAVFMELGKVAFTGGTNDAISRYLERNLRALPNHSEAAHVVFCAPYDARDHREFIVTKVELLDDVRKPKPIVSTWDAVVIRIHFYCRRATWSGAVEFQVRSIDGTKILRFSTQPDHDVIVNFKSGLQWIDCIVEELPLPSGTYVIAAGLTRPNVERLCWSDEIGIIEVHSKDVYASGLPPSADRALVVTRYAWQPGDCAPKVPSCKP